MYALIDCNNFYVSCERKFRPDLNNKPVVVLSNNDGCIISRSNEAKALGIKMGEPYFKVKNLLKDNAVQVFSSNYTLYADMSARVMNNLARFTPDVEVYSIDECFLKLTGFTDLENYATIIRTHVIKNTAIPISVGVAPTKTLAKLANKIAKKQASGVCVLQTEEKIKEALESFPVEDIWGIGYAYQQKLKLSNINTAVELRSRSLEWIKSNLTIQGLRIWHELWGKECLSLNQSVDRKKSICSSRSFGQQTKDVNDLIEAAASYTTRLAEKLRIDKSCATIFSVQLLTNRFDKVNCYNPKLTIALNHPCNNTQELVKVAVNAVKQIFDSNYLYNKVAVLATGLIPEDEVQLNFFTAWDGGKNNKVSKLMDKLNQHYGAGSIRLAAEGFEKKWAMKRLNLSPAYTTEWKDIIRVH